MGWTMQSALLFLIVGRASAFVFTCDETKKLANTEFHMSTRYVCVVPDSFCIQDNINYYNSSFSNVFARNNNVNTSFADLIVSDSHCLDGGDNAIWTIVADDTKHIDCQREWNQCYSNIVLIFTSLTPKINLVAGYDIKTFDFIVQPLPNGPEEILANPSMVESNAIPWYTFIEKKSCSGRGYVTISTGAGNGPSQDRYPYKSWSCADLPDWIIAIDNVITISRDDSVSLVADFMSHGTILDFRWINFGRRVAVISSGQSDNSLLGDRQGAGIATTPSMKGWTVSATCSPCSFSPSIRRSVSVNTDDDYFELVEENEFVEEGTCTFTNYFEIDVMINQAFAEDTNHTSGYHFVVEILFDHDSIPDGPTSTSTTTTTRKPTTTWYQPGISASTRVNSQTSTTRPITQQPSVTSDLYCGCELDKKFGMPVGWDSTQFWIDVVIILDTSEAMGQPALLDASTLIETFVGDDDDDVVLTTDPTAPFYTRIGVIAMSDKAEVLYNLNMTEGDTIFGKVHITNGLPKIDVADALDAALNMLSEGQKGHPDRSTARQVVYFVTDSDAVNNDLTPFDKFKSSGVIIVNNFLKMGESEPPGLREIASDGYFYSDIQKNYMSTIQLFCKANCFCRSDRIAYNGGSSDPTLQAGGGCFQATASGFPYTKARTMCNELGGGLIASIHDANKAQFVEKLLKNASPNSDYFWIGYSKLDDGMTWRWEDQSTDPYTNWDWANGEPSSQAVAKCAYMDTTTPGLFWGAGNCNVGFPSVCEFAPCSAGNKNC